MYRLELTEAARRKPGAQRRRGVLRPIGPRLAGEREIAIALSKMLRDAARKMREQGMPQAVSMMEQLQVRDSAHGFSLFMQLLRDYLLSRGEILMPLFRQIFGREEVAHRDSMSSAIRADFGVDVSPILRASDVAPHIEAAMIRSAGLVRGLSEELVKRLALTVTDAAQKGERSRTMAQRIAGDFGWSVKRARFIARDQMATFNGTLNKVRQMQLGIEEYEWSTSLDERVRPEHADREGRRFRWDDPPWDGHPGEPINCRCVARAVVLSGGFLDSATGRRFAATDAGFDKYEESEHPRGPAGRWTDKPKSSKSNGGRVPWWQRPRKGETSGRERVREANSRGYGGQSKTYERDSGKRIEGLGLRNNESARSFYVNLAKRSEWLEKGVTPVRWHELYLGDAGVFRRLITEAKNSNEWGASVAVYSEEEYAQMRLFISEDGLTGFALKGEDIVSVFKHEKSDAKQIVTPILKLATELGGRRLDCFDTMLPRLYAREGFRAVARVKFNDEYAPEGWDKKLYGDFNGGNPDVVFMVYDPSYGEKYRAGDGPYVAEYDDGLKAQMAALGEIDNWSEQQEFLKRTDEIRPIAYEVADKLGYSKAAIKFSQKDHEFTLNGMQMKAAGTADLQSGFTTLYPRQIYSVDIVPGVMAHEIMHHKWEYAKRMYEHERQQAIQQSAEGRAAGNFFELITVTGDLNPKYAEWFPIYAKLFPFMDKQNIRKRLREEDGCSDYSDAYWKQYEAASSNTHFYDSAVHETLAELARLDYESNGEHFKRVIRLRDSPWTDLYRIVNELWAEKNKR